MIESGKGLRALTAKIASKVELPIGALHNNSKTSLTVKVSTCSMSNF